MQDFTGVPCVVDLAAMRDAMVALGGDPEPDQPADSGRARDRPLGHRRRLRRPDAFRSTPGGVRAQPASATSSCGGPSRRSTTSRGAARHRHLPPGQPRVPGPGGVIRDERRELAYPGHAGRYRLAHPDGQRSRRPRLGGRRHRGRGRDARPADEMLIPQVVGFKLTGELPEGTTATDLVLTVAELLRRTGVVGKFVEFYGPGVASTAREPGHDRQHEPGVRLDVRDLPDRRRDADLSAAHRTPASSRSGWSRPTPRSRASGTTRPRAGLLPVDRARPGHRRAVASPDRSARRTGSRSPTAQRPSRRLLASPATAADDARSRGLDEAVGRVISGQRPSPVDRRPRATSRAVAGSTVHDRRRAAIRVPGHVRRRHDVDDRPRSRGDRGDHLAARTPPIRPS